LSFFILERKIGGLVEQTSLAALTIQPGRFFTPAGLAAYPAGQAGSAAGQGDTQPTKLVSWPAMLPLPNRQPRLGGQATLAAAVAVRCPFLPDLEHRLSVLHSVFSESFWLCQGSFSHPSNYQLGRGFRVTGSCFISIEVESTVPSFQCCVGVLWCPVVFLVIIQQPVGSRASQLQCSVVLEGNLGTVAISREILNWLPFTTI
jgi:hypothetical protein